MEPIEIRPHQGGGPLELPFTEEELFRAFRLAMPEAAARELAAHTSAIPADVAEGRAIGYMLADGTLLLLSVLSPALCERVKRWYGGPTAIDEADWDRRVEELRAKLESEGRL